MILIDGLMVRRTCSGISEVAGDRLYFSEHLAYCSKNLGCVLVADQLHQFFHNIHASHALSSLHL